MTKGNLFLCFVLVGVAGLWALSRDGGGSEGSGLGPRFFPDFNKEAADRIVIESGWKKSRWEFEKLGSEWRMTSGGGYPAKAEAAEKLVDAVYAIRAGNSLGASDELRQNTRTGEHGRLVRVFRGDDVMAEFRIGKRPQGNYDTYFIRKESDNAIYRTRTVTDEEPPETPQEFANFPGAGIQGFSWHSYTEQLYNWLDKSIWSLNDSETQEIWLSRADDIDVKLIRKGEDEWELHEADKDPVPADSDAVQDILSQMRSLGFEEVVGNYEADRGEYELEKPAITVILKQRKKIEKKEPEKPDGEEKPEKDEKPAEPEYREFLCWLQVGKKMTLPAGFHEEKLEEKEFYAVRINAKPVGSEELGEPDLEKKLPFVYIVDQWKIGPLKKTIEELRQKPKEEEGKGEPADEGPPIEGPEEGCGEDEEGGDEEGCGCGEETDPEAPDEPDEDEPEEDEEGCDDGCEDGEGGKPQ